MSNYTHFSKDVDLWEHQPRQYGRSHNLCPLSEFQVREIMLSELYVLSQAGAWGNVEKPKHDMAFLLIVPDKTIKRERVFWPGSSVGTPAPSPPPLPALGSMQAHTTD